MVFCKYFLQGSCRFGQNCRFEHAYPGQNPNQYSGQTGLKQIWKMMEQEVIASEKGNQWPLSCFAVFKEGQCFPGFEDVSPEEIRWLMYQARMNGTVDQCMSQIQQLHKIAEQKRNEIKHPSVETYNLIGKLSKDKLGYDPSGTQNNSSNIFRQANQLQTNVFSNSAPGTSTSTNIFSTQTPTNNIFSSNQQQGTNIFGTAQQPTSNIFATPQQQTSNVFGSPQQQTTNVFGAQQQTSNVFGSPQQQPSSVFGSPQQQQTSNVFGTQQNVFGSVPTTSNFFSGTPQTQSVFGVVSPISNTTATSGLFPPQQNTNIFGNQSVFGSVPQTQFKFEVAPQQNQTSTSNVFQQPQTSSNSFVNVNKTVSNPFQRPVVQQRDPVNYTKLELLSESDKEQFLASRFTYGKIPLIPPPMECCFTD